MGSPARPSAPAAHGHPVLAGRALTRIYQSGERTVTAVDSVDIAVARGEFVAIVGPSGCGKSTLLHLLGGIDRPTSGDVALEGRSISQLSDADLALVRRRRLGFVLQFFNLMPTLSAVENTAFPLLLDGRRDALDVSRAALARVGLDHRADHRPFELSGGEQQRVAVARALVTEPAVIFADEPTGSLDTRNGAAVLELIAAVAEEGQAVVMVTHDPHCADAADRVVRLLDGRLDGISDDDVS